MKGNDPTEAGLVHYHQANVTGTELAAGELVSLPLGKRKLHRHSGVGHLHGRRLSLGEETFVGLCQSVTHEFTARGASAVA